MKHEPILVGILLGLTACSNGKSGDEKQTAKTSPTVPSATEDSKALGSLVIRVDGEVVRSIRASDLSTRRTLFSLLPSEHQGRESWHSINAKGNSRTLKIAQSMYPGATISLDAKDNDFSIGLYLPIPSDAKPHVRQQLEKPHLQLQSVEEVDLRSQAPKAKAPVAFQPLELLLDDSQVAELTAESFAKLPIGLKFTERRNPERHPTEQYQLSDVISAHVPLEKIKSLTLHTARRSIRIDVDALVAEDQRHLLKRNRRGIWVYRSYKEKSPGVQEELRGIVRVETRSTIKP